MTSPAAVIPIPGTMNDKPQLVWLIELKNIESARECITNHLNKCSSNGVPKDIADARVTVPNPHYEAPNTQCSNGANLAKSNIFSKLGQLEQLQKHEVKLIG